MVNYSKVYNYIPMAGLVNKLLLAYQGYLKGDFLVCVPCIGKVNIYTLVHIFSVSVEFLNQLTYIDRTHLSETCIGERIARAWFPKRGARQNKPEAVERS